jgi:glucosamine--fructose-6-phosphate aminotransferase (isomerizing)
MAYLLLGYEFKRRDTGNPDGNTQEESATMCGIIGYFGKKEPVGILLSGLERLEYRGYDSAGVAFFETPEKIGIIRAEGKMARLREAVGDRKGLPLAPAIGHIRWATHGAPTEENAHPHRSGPIVLVHNGIIENERELRKELVAEGAVFTSETDTEVVAHLVHRAYARSGNFLLAVREGLERLTGSFALAILCEEAPGEIVAVRNGAPLVLGMGEEEVFVASDIPAFLSWTRSVYPVANGELVHVQGGKVSLMGLADGRIRPFTPETVSWDPLLAEKGHFRHFMEKEIQEGPRAIMDTLEGRLAREEGRVLFPELARLGPTPTEIVFVACGTSYHAALMGRLMIEELSDVPVRVEIASEFRYRPVRVRTGAWVIGISQSGETADTLGALERVRKEGFLTVGVTNVPGSSIARECEATLVTRAGPEIGVASTKAFVAQITLLWLLALYLGKKPPGEMFACINDVVAAPSRLESFLGHVDREKIDRLAGRLRNATLVLFVGRGYDYPLALEGALKFKEVTYRHADGYPGGELKHGPIALVEPGVMVIAPLIDPELGAKERSNLREIEARGGEVIALTAFGPEETEEAGKGFGVPGEGSRWDRIFSVLAVLQLLSYRSAVLLGNDVDQPRNLAKSVTVE